MKSFKGATRPYSRGTLAQNLEAANMQLERLSRRRISHQHQGRRSRHNSQDRRSYNRQPRIRDHSSWPGFRSLISHKLVAIIGSNRVILANRSAEKETANQPTSPAYQGFKKVLQFLKRKSCSKYSQTKKSSEMHMARSHQNSLKLIFKNRINGESLIIISES